MTGEVTFESRYQELANAFDAFVQNFDKSKPMICRVLGQRAVDIAHDLLQKNESLAFNEGLAISALLLETNVRLSTLPPDPEDNKVGKALKKIREMMNIQV